MTWICKACTTPYAPGSPHCPQCGADDHEDEGAAEMAKITKSGGPSDQNAPTERPGEGDFFQPAAAEPVPVPEEPSASATKADWVTFAEQVNDHPDLPTPLDEPAAATKAELVDYYSDVTTPAEG